MWLMIWYIVNCLGPCVDSFWRTNKMMQSHPLTKQRLFLVDVLIPQFKLRCTRYQRQQLRTFQSNGGHCPRFLMKELGLGAISHQIWQEIKTRKGPKMLHCLFQPFLHLFLVWIYYIVISNVLFWLVRHGLESARSQAQMIRRFIKIQRNQDVYLLLH